MIELPTKISKIEAINPENLLLFGLEKIGKTTELSKLPNHLFIDLERGTRFIECQKISVPENKGPVGKFQWVKDVARTIMDKGRPYDYVIADTLTELDEWSEWVGTFKYMNSVSGKNFNRYTEDNVTEGKEVGDMLPFGHPDYLSVHTLAQGFGYQWSRNEMIEMYNLLSGLGKICTIFVCHVADKVVESKKEGKDIVVKEIALTGKVKSIISRKVDGVGYLFTKDGQMNISFKGSEDRAGGIRGEHLRSLRDYEGPLDWNQIFINQ